MIIISHNIHIHPRPQLSPIRGNVAHLHCEQRYSWLHGCLHHWSPCDSPMALQASKTRQPLKHIETISNPRQSHGTWPLICHYGIVCCSASCKQGSSWQTTTAMSSQVKSTCSLDTWIVGKVELPKIRFQPWIARL